MHPFAMLEEEGVDIRRRTRTPKKLSKGDLVSKVIKAAKEIGIQDIIILEWDYKAMRNYPTCGGLRERKYGGKTERDEELDLGYFKITDRKEYSVRSFLVNPWVFSDGKANTFLDALKRQGLEPEIFFPIENSWIVEEAYIRMWKNRTPLYQ